MPEATVERLPQWPLRVALSLLLVVEAFLVLRLSVEGVTENIVMIVHSVGLLVFGVLTWRGIPWSRWLVFALLVLRVADVGYHLVTAISPSDHRFIGTLIIAVFYAALGSVIASPLGLASKRAAG